MIAIVFVSEVGGDMRADVCAYEVAMYDGDVRASVATNHAASTKGYYTETYNQV